MDNICLSKFIHLQDRGIGDVSWVDSILIREQPFSATIWLSLSIDLRKYQS